MLFDQNEDKSVVIVALESYPVQTIILTRVHLKMFKKKLINTEDWLQEIEKQPEAAIQTTETFLALPE